MSGPFGSSQWMYSSGFYPYAIDNSLRFNDDDSAYLSRTPASAGNRKTWTWSGWVKRGNSGLYQTLFMAGTGTTSNFRLVSEFTDSKFQIYYYDGGNKYILPSAVHRDHSAWYHVVFACDTTQATSSNRLKIYINGEQITSLSTENQPSLNYNTEVNAATLHTIGRRTYAADQYFDGYLANIHFIDGTALDASSFGETKSGIWVAKSYSGSYGTNGFHLKFDGNVNDSSGNSNNWTANNISAHDYVPDSPTLNFAVLNPLFPSPDGAMTLSEGNLKANDSSGNCQTAPTIACTGKSYFEFIDTDPNGSIAFSEDAGVGGTMYYNLPNLLRIHYNATYTVAGGVSITINSGSLFSWSTTDIVGVAYDADNHTLILTKNGGSAVNITINGLSGNSLTPQFVNYSSGSATAFLMNFGQDSTFAGATTAGGNSDANGIGDFKYAPPSGGYLALCTSNLPAPAIDPAVDDVPEDYFNTTLFTANAGAQTITTGVDADFIWFKQRNGTQNHLLYDTVRGDTKRLVSNTTSGDINDDLLSLTFLSDGFSIDTSYTQNYASWNWKAGGTAVSNTDGSITSSVSANTKAGFSIVSYTGNGTQDQTIGHGLTAAPEMIIVKNRDESDSTFDDWWVYHIGTSFPQNRVLRLNESTAELSSTDFWYNSPTSTVFGVNDTGSSGYTNDNTKKYIAYCFHSVEGYSKMGSYVGNGSTDGPFVYTGFRPAWVMIKQIDSVNDWGIFDIKRNTFNSLNNVLYPNLSIAELSFSAGQGIDAISNGFKVRVGTPSLINTTSAPYIYLAFAEQPFKYSNAR